MLSIAMSCDSCQTVTSVARGSTYYPNLATLEVLSFNHKCPITSNEAIELEYPGYEGDPDVQGSEGFHSCT